jgi:two-component system, LytTR family, response regulator
VESFELDVLDYLVKPISFPRFLKGVNKLATPKSSLSTEANNTKSEPEKVWLKVDKKMVSLAPQDIYYLQSLKDYVRVVTADQKLIIYHTLQALLDKLPVGEFIRIHKSFVVQVSKIKSIEGNKVKVRSELLPIGRNFRKGLTDIYRIS